MELEASSKKRKISAILNNDEVDIYQPRKRIKLDLETRHQSNEILPQEIMVEVFSNLTLQDLCSCSVTCKYWLECESATSKGWIFVGRDEIQILTGSERNQKFDELYYSEEAFKLTAKLTPPWCSVNVSAVADPDVQIAGSIWLSDVPPKGVQFLPYMFVNNEFSTSIESKQWQIECTASGIQSSQKAFYIDYFFNVSELESAVEKGYVEWEKALINIMVGKEVIKLIDKESVELMNPRVRNIPKSQTIDTPLGLKEGFKFRKYQLDAINWMAATEKEADKEFKYCDLVPWHASRSSVLINLHDKKFVSSDKAGDLREYTKILKLKGGVLADVTGLGKTLEIIGLALLTLKQEFAEIGDNGLYNTRATLVVCPANLVQHWVDEVTGFTEMKVIAVSKFEELKSIAYDDIATSGFVIISSAVLQDNKYFDACSKLKKNKPKRDAAGFAARVEHLKIGLERVKAGKGLKTKLPLLEHFNFPRIVLDDAPSILTLGSYICDIICGIPKSFGWYVSAKPFKHDLDAKETIRLAVSVRHFARRFFEIEAKVDNTDIGNRYEEHIQHTIINNHFTWRNTPRSIMDPAYAHTKIFNKIHFHPVEMLLYKEASSREQKANVLKGLLPGGTIDDTIALRISSLKKEEENWQRKLANFRPVSSSRVQTKPNYRYTSSHCNSELAKIDKLLSEWNAVDTVLANKHIEDTEELAHLTLVNNYGSKVAALIEWLNKTVLNNPEKNRVVIFSQDPTYLSKIHDALIQNNIKAVHIQGNVLHRMAAIKRCIEEDVRVALTLLKDAADLSPLEANYVVPLDPIQGSTRSQSHEQRALGRVCLKRQDRAVHLVRFAVEDTVETRQDMSP